MNWLLNINANQALVYVVIRSFLLFGFSIILIRYGNRRYNLNTASDYLLLVIFGGLISRGINGQASLMSTLIAVSSLVIFHRVIAVITYRSPHLESFIKGHARLIVKDGQFLLSQLQKYHLTQSDILTEMRVQLNEKDIQLVSAAYLEPTGRISFIRKKN
ncbi:DUF421 domain-containing protein [Legionella jamestowniensis]|uniref:YetF C-terminal domain-containing protein n=1 Tax=Legionella jamestowniensis TaxID=455 RepID=A0A0W0UI89_9GAMM|nr:YetF domain-containing protein [Legionella jamestowniensis]KTD07557.1 hypothetical protein Ljam_1752 [Legionella jamestowniensis]OCH97675.1 hypothetical protein A8135_02220 [Legionella jamestowniensis]SFM01722.1 Protein of unknown function [Legionella jamestowniensis DSM 19215]